MMSGRVGEMEWERKGMSEEWGGLKEMNIQRENENEGERNHEKQHEKERQADKGRERLEHRNK